MTHAEAASCRDGCWPHENYGPYTWEGTGERWDLMQLYEEGNDDGGEILREKIRRYMDVDEFPSSDQVLRTVQIDCNGTSIEGLLYSNKSTYAPISALAKAYNFGIDWNPKAKKVVLFGENMPLPKYVQDSLGLEGVPLVDVCGRDGNVIMVGFIKDPDQVYVKVLEFASEFNIPLKVVDGTIKLGSLKNYGG